MRCRRILAAGLGALLLYPVLLAGQEPRKITVVARKSDSNLRPECAREVAGDRTRRPGSQPPRQRPPANSSSV